MIIIGFGIRGIYKLGELSAFDGFKRYADEDSNKIGINSNTGWLFNFLKRK